MMSNGPRARHTASKRTQQISDGSTSMNSSTNNPHSPLMTKDYNFVVNGVMPPISDAMNNGKLKPRRKRKKRDETSSSISLTRIIIFVFIFLFAGWLGWVVAARVFLDSEDMQLVSKERAFDGNNNNNNLDEAPFSILVVGGSDGSGTRAFCWALQQLGVVLLVDDKHTMDIEASQLFDRSGWPGFVRYVLEQTKGSLDYTWDDLSPHAHKVLKHEIGRFQKHLKLIYENTKIRIQHTKKHDEKMGTVSVPIKASRIHFAIKAPASMLVLPVLKHVFQQELKFPVTFLHVVRDGRDVSLSQNQSPAQKFYNSTFPNDYLQRMEQWKDDLYNVRAMQLWNDWNLQVWNNHHPKGRPNHDQLPSQQLTYNPNYLLVRSEDLVHSKWEVMQALHQFVDSTMPMEDLCCQSHAKDKDLGESVHFADTSKHHGAMNPHRHLRKPPRGGRGNWGGFKGHDGGDIAAGDPKAALNLIDWLKESERALARERNRDPRRNLQDAESDSYTLDELMNQGVPLFKRFIDEKQGKMVVKHLEHLVQAARAKLDADYKEWKQKFVRRNRGSEDAEQQTAYYTRTGTALLNQARNLQHARMALFARRNEIQTDSSYDRPSDKVVKDIMKDLIKRLHMLEDDSVQHAFARGQGGDEVIDGYVDRNVLEKRYGKWQGLLEDKPDLSKFLHQEGAKGLEHFGYEPYQDFVYPKLDYECTQEQLLQCSTAPSEEKQVKSLLD